MFRTLKIYKYLRKHYYSYKHKRTVKKAYTIAAKHLADAIDEEIYQFYKGGNK